ncbi:hypothetical protein ACHRV6_08445 [Flavobacterium sp. FlaQc-51]|uniref:hypothetical protein n=1 Tax=Flavobacterium sp. FlaQc-51 TaxID=3374184 RepID=UPI003757BFF4
MFRADGSGSELKSYGGTIYIVASGFNPMDNMFRADGLVQNVKVAEERFIL